MALILFDAIRTHDVRRALGAIQAPTLVLTNRYDSAVHPDNSREIAALVPGATLHLLDGNEHDPFIRDSGSMVEAILDFLAGRPLGHQQPKPSRVTGPLSPREIEVLRLLAEGHPNKVIAQRLEIGVATVERHVASIYRKVGARGRADAALHAVSLGLVPLPTP